MATILHNLFQFKEDAASSQKNVLHYVMISDHLKPNKIWRPDAISPHVCAIVTNEFSDVKEVTLAGPEFQENGREGLLFKRMNIAELGTPETVNGRLVFQCDDKNMPPRWQGIDQIYLYWDGEGRWVISPKKGESAPYGGLTAVGEAAQDYTRFLSIRDAATTPDKIGSKPEVLPERAADDDSPPPPPKPPSWRVWKNNQWVEDESIKIPRASEDIITKADQLKANANTMVEDQEEDKPFYKQGLLGEIVKSLGFLFMASTSLKMPPELKECLISLSGQTVCMTWKDANQEQLAPFRKYLLAEFGTYQAAWVHLMRKSSLRKPDCVSKLIVMMKTCHKELNAAVEEMRIIEKKKKDGQIDESAKVGYQIKNDGNDAKEAQVTKSKSMKSTDSRKKKRGFMGNLLGSGEGEGFGSSLFGGSKKKTVDLTKQASKASLTGEEPNKSGRQPMSAKDLTESSRVKIEAYLESVGVMDTRDAGKRLKDAAIYIFNHLDKNNDGGIPAEELMMLYGDASSDPQIKAFQDFLKAHPQYNKIEKLFCELSENSQISLPEFKDSAKSLLVRFDNLTKGQAVRTADQKAEDLFQKLDAHKTKTVSYNELVPVTGPTAEDADKHLIQMRVPLAYIKEIRMDGERKSGQGNSSGAAALRFWVNPQFEQSPEWSCLKRGLNPEWEPNPGFETLNLTMLPEYLEMWKQVIRDCNMGQAQEWIRFYDGAIQDHHRLDGVYMRHGAGIQRWPTGQTYNGEWANHVYEGQGKLYERHEDMLEDLAPIYNGQWKRGKRHGVGMLRWEQDTADRKRSAHVSDRQYAGVTKIYEGTFQDDLFHGQGKLYLERAVAQSLPGKATSAGSLKPGKVPHPVLDGGSLLSFEGTFESDWKKIDALVREANHLYDASHQVKDAEGNFMKDLNLHLCSKRDQMKQVERFTRYFEVDLMKVQHAGHQLPDLAMALYTRRGGEVHSFKYGKAKYADFSVYEGEFADGAHNGKGKVTQYEVGADGKKGKEMATYEGEFKDGKFHGKGVYKLFGPMGFTYDGEWAENLRHGEGTQILEKDAEIALGYRQYEGHWENDNFDGKGKLSYGASGNGGECTYEGDFNDGQREGKGKVFRMKGEEKIMVMHCVFTDDKIDCSKENAWCVLGEKEIRYFYGKITSDGNIAGSGTMYGEHAAQDEAFMKCLEDGVPYEAEDVSNPKTLKLIEYQGTWKDNMPHGYGVQHFEGDPDTGDHHGNYYGDFFNGQRHGRGTWTTLKGTWMYRPIAAENVANWEHDLMHGIGIVEDRKSVHENVIYTKGVCQMPFTDLGPPKTGWEVGGLNELQPGVIRKRNAVKPYNTLYVEDSAAEEALEKAGLVKDGWDGYDPVTSMLAVKNALGLLALETMVVKSRKHRNPDATLGAIAEAHTLVDHDVAALVREPTDLSMPEEDVIIAGATGVNEVMNGVYFKLSQTFGVKAFKMVKMFGAGAVSKGHPIVRFLYKDTATGAWTISPRPMAGIVPAPGCAFSHDEYAEHPSMVSSEWYVWHPHTQALQTKASAIKEQAKEAEKAKTRSTWESIMASLESAYPEPDILVCRSMVGFEMTASAEKLGHVGKGLMLRIPQTLYGRPVYEAESGGQFLYFLKDDGDLADGMNGWEEFEAGTQPHPDKLFAMSGNWILSREIALPVDQALGYCKDLAVTPDLLESQWKILQLDGSWDWVPDLKLRRQEWTHQSILEAETPSTAPGEEKPLLEDVPSRQ